MPYSRNTAALGSVGADRRLNHDNLDQPLLLRNHHPIPLEPDLEPTHLPALGHHGLQHAFEDPVLRPCFVNCDRDCDLRGAYKLTMEWRAGRTRTSERRKPRRSGSPENRIN